MSSFLQAKMSLSSVFFVCNQLGSMGDKFYIILYGTVGVMIPNSDVKDFKKRLDDLQK